MADLNGFNANDYEPNPTFDPIPEGKYPAAITASEIRPTKRGDGSYLQIEFTVTDGEFTGRKVWDRLCINHPKELTQKIARGDLSMICRAVGVLQPRDSSDLHNIPLIISVKCKKRDDNGELTNEVKSYEAIEQTAETPQSAPQAPANTAPWKR